MKEIILVAVIVYMVIAFALTRVGANVGPMMLIAAPGILIVVYLTYMSVYLGKEVKGL
jgi:hypothetical protein